MVARCMSILKKARADARKHRIKITLLSSGLDELLSRAYQQVRIEDLRLLKKLSEFPNTMDVVKEYRKEFRKSIREYRSLLGKKDRATSYLIEKCIERRREAFVELRDILDQVSHVCGNCSSNCCNNTTGYYSDIDYLYLAATGKDKLVNFDLNGLYDRLFDGNDSACMWLSPSGCVLESDIRPYTCAVHSCESLLGALRKKGQVRKYNTALKGLHRLNEYMSSLCSYIKLGDSDALTQV